MFLHPTPFAIAARGKKKLLPLHSRIVILGNSQAAARGFAGFMDWALFFTRGRFYPKVVGAGPVGWNLGTVGNTTTQMIARISTVGDENPKVAIFEGGTNDYAAAGATPTTVNANYDSFVAYCRARNIIPIITAIFPRGSVGWNGTMETYRQTSNAYAQSLLGPNFIPADDIITNTTTHLQSDLTHLNFLGAHLYGRRLAERLNKLIVAADIFDSPGNLYANGDFAGGATVATSWTAFAASNGITKANSKSTVNGRTSQKFVGSGTASSGVADNYNQTVTPPGGLQNDRHEAWVEVLVTRASGLNGMSISAGTNNTNSSHLSITSVSGAASLDSVVPFTGVMRAPESLLSANGATMNSRISILPAVGAVDYELEFMRARFRKVPATQ